MSLYYDKDGTVLGLLDWASKFENTDYRIVKITKRGDIRVSTDWEGLNPVWAIDDLPPMIFETMVFGGDLDGEQWRYPTEAAALQGHNDVVKQVFGND